MNFIKNAIEGKVDELTHKQFRRFSKGTFDKRAMFEIKKSKSDYSIKTTFEYLDGILIYLSGHIDRTAEVSGTIIGSGDLLSKARKYGLDGEPKSAMCVKKLELIPAKIEFSKLNEMVNEFKEEFPKPGKSKSEGSAKPDKINFCKIKTSDAGLVRDLLFDFNGDFRQAITEHTFLIEDFEVPKEYENDPAKARSMAKRKGRIIRKSAIDGKLQEKTYDFSA